MLLHPDPIATALEALARLLTLHHGQVQDALLMAAEHARPHPTPQAVLVPYWGVVPMTLS